MHIVQPVLLANVFRLHALSIIEMFHIAGNNMQCEQNVITHAKILVMAILKYI